MHDINRPCMTHDELFSEKAKEIYENSILTNENYFSFENSMFYMSTSQIKAFRKCQAGAMAELKGEYVREKTSALLIGSYVDAHFEGTLSHFKAINPDIFLKSGGLKAEYRNAEDIINRLERDKFFMEHMEGQKQVILTGEIAGVLFKTKMDVYVPGKHIVDLKIMRDFKDIWVDGLKISFIEAWEYDLQGAVYQAVEKNKLPFLIAGATKEKEPDLEIFSIPQQRLDFQLDRVKQEAPLFDNIKQGLIEPECCGTCNYCRFTKKLNKVISYVEYGISEEVE